MIHFSLFLKVLEGYGISLYLWHLEVIPLIHFLNASSGSQPSLTTLLEREAVICFGVCALGLEVWLFPGRKADLLSALLVLQRPFRPGSGHNRKWPWCSQGLPCFMLPACFCWWGNMCPFRTFPQAYHVALFSTPHLVFLALCAPVDLKMLNITNRFLWMIVVFPLGHFCSCYSFLGRMWDLGKACTLEKPFYLVCTPVRFTITLTFLKNWISRHENVFSLDSWITF